VGVLVGIGRRVDVGVGVNTDAVAVGVSTTSGVAVGVGVSAGATSCMTPKTDDSPSDKIGCPLDASRTRAVTKPSPKQTASNKRVTSPTFHSLARMVGIIVASS
jgi:hypothetical protein